MATFLPACHGHRVKAVVRRRGFRSITRTFDNRKEAELWAADVERQMAQGVYADLVHRSRQKIHPSLAAQAMVPRFQPYPGADRVNLLNASVH